MKYKNVKVVSHPRAGSHYLAQLLNINFYHHKDYLPLYAGHSQQHVVWLKHHSTCIIYIHRDIDNSVESMYNLKDRFGLVSHSLEHFKNNKLTDMHSSRGQSQAIRNINGKEVIVTKVDSALSCIDCTPGEYIYKHQEWWLRLGNKNFLSISYENLTQDFEATMLKIAQFIGSDRTEFVQESTRVGWYDANDEKKIFT